MGEVLATGKNCRVEAFDYYQKGLRRLVKLRNRDKSKKLTALIRKRLAEAEKLGKLIEAEQASQVAES